MCDTKKSFSTVAEFYDGKSVFITGAAGYLGVLILETLLELCPGVRTVFVLLRERRGVGPDKRKEALLQKPVFDKIKAEMPEVLDKVRVVPGDVSLPDFGMSDGDLQDVVENVSVMFHCAACINFSKTLKYILQHNVLSTQYAIDICRKFNKLDALVYTSSSYGNANRRFIQEKIYRLHFEAQYFLDEIKTGTDESLTQLMRECHSNWPNFYTFSKSLAENVLQDNAADLPVIVVRPSIIGNVWKRPLPGYIEENSGITALSIGVGKGFLKCLKGDPNSIFDFVTGDICASTHVIAAWSVATHRSPPLHVLNCCSTIVVSTGAYSTTMVGMGEWAPLPNTFRKVSCFRFIRSPLLHRAYAFYQHYVPAYAFDALLKLRGSKMRKVSGFRFIRSPLLHWAYAFDQHYVPAYAFDALLKLRGSKMRLVPIYRMADRASDAVSYFLSNTFTFATENFQNILKQLQKEDQKLFEVEQTNATLEEVVHVLPVGSEFYQWNKDKKSKEERMKIATQRLWLTNIFKAVFLFGVSLMLYFIISFAYGLLQLICKTLDRCD